MKSASLVALLQATTMAQNATSPDPFVAKFPGQTPPCRKTTPEHLRNPGVVGAPLTDYAGLPEQWLWSNIDGVNYLTEIKNQHIPSYCGSCWAQAATSAMSDRIKIARKAAWPDINIAPQVVISCSTIGGDDGCHGGEAFDAYQYMHENQVTDETCSIYRARGRDNGEACSAELKCQECFTDCGPRDNYKIYNVKEYGRVKGEEAMMQEIYQRGPIACGVAVTDAFLNYKGGILQNQVTHVTDIDHDISVIGWGVENGIKYWTIRNSWGSAFGEDGFIRVERGVNEVQVETDCAWGTVVDTWTDDVRHHNTPAENADRRKGNADDLLYAKQMEKAGKFLAEDTRKCSIHNPDRETKHVGVPSWEQLKGTVYPDSLDWRNMDGINYLSWNKNQHIPHYCGSCWAQGPTSALADRFQIMLGITGSATPVGLNAQYVVNWQAGKTVDDNCNGGDPMDAWQFAHDTGIVDSSCEQYVAQNFAGTPGPKQICKDCTWPPCPADKAWSDPVCQDKCWGTTPNRMYYSQDYYGVHGVE